MKDKIQIGEYIRTEYGIIGKILEDEDITENGVYIDTTFLDDYADETNFVKYEDIKKHSFNITDLIEVGDYINGHKIVSEIWGEDDNELYFEIEGGFNKADYISEKDIKSIVTKEQFSRMEYKVVE